MTSMASLALLVVVLYTAQQDLQFPMIALQMNAASAPGNSTFMIGKYSLNSNVREYPDLTEVSPLASAAVEKAYKGERIYRGEDISENGRTWAVVVSALPDGKIYKIAAQFMSTASASADAAYSETLQRYNTQFGHSPQETTPSGGQRWNEPFGNVILGRVSAAGIYAINLIVTSNDRPVSELEK